MTQPTGGVPPRRPDQSYTPPPPAISPSSGDIVRARQVIIVGTGGELLVYSPTAGAGNLIASIAGAAGHDQYGNTIVQGVGVYNAAAHESIQVNNASVTWANSNTGATVSAAQDSVSGNLVLVGSNGKSAPPVIEAASPGAPTTTPEAWNTVSSGFATGWSGTFEYAYLPIGPPNSILTDQPAGAVAVSAAFNLSGATVADGTTIFTISSSAYAPNKTQTLPAAGDGGFKAVNGGENTQLRIDSAGDVKCFGVSTTATYLQVSGLYWLGT